MQLLLLIKKLIIEMDRLKDLFGIEHNIIQGANGILNGKVLRFKNEPVRHKTLDLIGDLALTWSSNQRSCHCC